MEEGSSGFSTIKYICFTSFMCFLVTPELGVHASVIRQSPNDAERVPSGHLQDDIDAFTDSSPNGDLIPDDYKIIVKLDAPPDVKLDPIHVSQLRKVLASEVGVSLSNMQVSQVRGNKLEFYIIYSIPYEDGARTMSVLIPVSKILQKLSVDAVNRALTTVLRVVYITQKIDLRDVVTVKSAVSGARIWSLFEKEIWQSWQLPFLVISCLLLVLLVVVGVVFLCFRQQIYLKKKVENDSKKHVCLFPVVKPVVDHTDSVQPEPTGIYLSEKNFEVLKYPIRIKAKGLLERRGSNASLTIDLNPSLESLTACSISRNNSNEDYLLSAGNRMTRKQLCNCIKDTKALHSEFWEIPMNHPERVEIAGFGMKNRYKTILPNEHSRVKLDELNNDPLTTYINANYIRGYDGEDKCYIATQGPMFHTICDFWRMIWQERVSTIVMITKLREKNKIKCEPYLPDGTCKFGDIEVTVNQIVTSDGYVVRHLSIRKGNKCSEIKHYWYTSWPDHRTPANPQQLLSLALEVDSGRLNNFNKCKGPILVHCSAGIGRTGCFIATSIGMRQLIEESMVDVLGIVCAMRQDRGGMIQTAEQYEFVHRALCLFEQSLPDQPIE